jgi:hypothetical protein
MGRRAVSWMKVAKGREDERLRQQSQIRLTHEPEAKK